VSALLGFARGDSLESICETLGVSSASVYGWLKKLMVEDTAGLQVHWKGGRPCKLTATQKGRLVELIKAGPEAAGFPTGCWNCLLIQQLIEREFGVLYNVHYLAELLSNLGFSFQKARFLSAHLDEEKRLQWLTMVWPALLARAQALGALVLFGDEASFAQWGSLGYTWAPLGEQPVVKTTGKRKAHKTFGLIDFFGGRLFHQGIEGRFNADTYTAFLASVLAQTTEPIFLVHDNASYHRAATVKQFAKDNASRLTVYHLPSYSPDYNPIEFLWRAVKRSATHNRYFPTLDLLVNSVEEALQWFAQHPEYVHRLFSLYLNRMAQPVAQAA
jgi:transposase